MRYLKYLQGASGLFCDGIFLQIFMPTTQSLIAQKLEKQKYILFLFLFIHIYFCFYFSVQCVFGKILLKT